MNMNSIEPLRQEQILPLLEAQAKSRLDELVILDTVDSTNDYLLKLAHKPQVIACFAEQQTAGKGQRGKQWVSLPGSQIALSVLWPSEKSPGEIRGLSLAIGVAAVRALRQYGANSGIQLKWPNDVYLQGKKLAGILVETAPDLAGGCRIVVGIGVNLYFTAEQVSALGQSAASLFEATQRPIACNRFAGLLLNEILLALDEFTKAGLAPFQEDWRRVDYLFNQRITVSSPQQVLTGLMHGITANGELVLVDDQRQSHFCLNGTVRLAVS